MEKIVIIGSSGAGKSTFAQELGDILEIEVVHLDRYFWRPDWMEYPREERLEIQQKLLRERKRWIIEGTYLGSSDDRLNAADTIIFLDIPWSLSLWRVIMRHRAASSSARPDIPDGCTDRVTFHSLLKVLAFPVKGRWQLLWKMKKFRKQSATVPEKSLLHYRSSKSAELFLQDTRDKQQKTLPSLMSELALEAQNQQDTATAPPARRGEAELFTVLCCLFFLGPDSLLVLSKFFNTL